ncbi:MAG: hypothetical protein K8R53_09505, partial [Bacteroidales bacterium]|nr:hypothetical protein [Bacteroidales bacterium]
FIALYISASAQTPNQEAISSSGFHGVNDNLDVSWTIGESVTETFNNGPLVINQGFQQPDLTIQSEIILDIKVFLEGPYSSGSNEMIPYLNALSQLPLSQPYNSSPWLYDGTETVSSIPNADIIDWILLELRETSGGPETATSNTMISRKACFLLKDGSVTETDGTSLPVFNEIINQNIYLVIWHRNHLGIMSADPLFPNNGIYYIDFSVAGSSVFGNFLAHKEIEPGIWGMVGGDGSPDGQINNNDKIDIWIPQSGSSGYLSGDFNMDIQVNNSDKNDIWAVNGAKGSQVPDGADKGYKSFVPK